MNFTCDDFNELFFGLIKLLVNFLGAMTGKGADIYDSTAKEYVDIARPIYDAVQDDFFREK